jgi:hypothetical protein
METRKENSAKSQRILHLPWPILYDTERAEQSKLDKRRYRFGALTPRLIGIVLHRGRNGGSFCTGAASVRTQEEHAVWIITHQSPPLGGRALKQPDGFLLMKSVTDKWFWWCSNGSLNSPAIVLLPHHGAMRSQFQTSNQLSYRSWTVRSKMDNGFNRTIAYRVGRAIWTICASENRGTDGWD